MTEPLTMTESTRAETGGHVLADLHAQFVLQRVQPALLGLMDGSVSTLAPIFARRRRDGETLLRLPHRPGRQRGRGG